MASDPSTADDNDYQVQYAEEDDERTIEEEEQLESDEEENELDDLEAGANMPLEELMKLYGQNASSVSRVSQGNDESSSSSDERIARQHRFHHLLHVNGRLLDEEEDGDETDDSFEPEIVKVINVGDEYQAQIEAEAEFDLVNDNLPVDELLWSPPLMDEIENEKIDEYLKTIRHEYPSADDEISLQVLLNCQMNPDLALAKYQQLPVKKIYFYREWSLEEIQRFEEGLKEYGKEFFKLTVFKCSNRTVREVIHYYYQWKKSDRYQSFMEEQQRLNAIASVTDMIERLIEEQEQQLCTAVGVINSTSSSSVISNDLKLNSSISFVTTTTTTTTTKRSFDQVDHDSEPSSSKKPSLNSSSSSTATIV